MTGASRGEGDVNLSPRRAAWRADLGAATPALLAEDERWFLRQSLSTLALIRWSGGRGVAHRSRRTAHPRFSRQQRAPGRLWPPRVIAAIAEMATLPFSPRRFTNRSAVDLARRLANLAPGAAQGFVRPRRC